MNLILDRRFSVAPSLVPSNLMGSEPRLTASIRCADSVCEHVKEGVEHTNGVGGGSPGRGGPGGKEG